MFSFLSLNDSLYADNYRDGTVNKKYLRLRLRPNTKSQVKETLKRNDKVTVLESSGKWYKIQTAFNQGWVKSKYISSSYYSTDTLAETDKDSLYGAKTDSVSNVSVASMSMPMKTTNNTNITSNSTNFNTTNSSVKGTLEKNSNKVLPKMNNTASKNKLQEVSNERNKYNNRDEDY